MDSMSNDGSAPATRTDLGRLDEKLDLTRADLGRLDEKIGLTRADLGRLDEKIGLTRADLGRLSSKFDGLKKRADKTDVSFRRLGIELLDLRAEVRDLKDVVATKADIQRFVDAVESFAGKAQSYDAAKALHGQALTDVQVRMNDRERRIKDLEDRPQ